VLGDDRGQDVDRAERHHPDGYGPHEHEHARRQSHHRRGRPHRRRRDHLTGRDVPEESPGRSGRGGQEGRRIQCPESHAGFHDVSADDQTSGKLKVEFIRQR
jgi:hypothetical protein